MRTGHGARAAPTNARSTIAHVVNMCSFSRRERLGYPVAHVMVSVLPKFLIKAKPIRNA